MKLSGSPVASESLSVGATLIVCFVISFALMWSQSGPRVPAPSDAPPTHRQVAAETTAPARRLVPAQPTPPPPTSRSPEPQAFVADESRAANPDAPVGMKMFNLIAVSEAEGAGARIAIPRNAREFSKTGLQPGDIITAVNGTPVHDPRSAANMLRASGSHSLSLTIMRDDETKIVQVDTLD